MSVRQGVNTIAGSGYTKSEVDTLLTGKADTALSNITATGKEVCANMGMPSDRYVVLTAGAAGSTYSMPADGYIYFNGRSTSQYANIGLISKSNNNTTLVSFNNYCQYANNYMNITIPVSKGQTVQISYFDTDTLQLRFVYANGVA